MSMASSPVRTILRVALVPLCLCIATASANAQADRCGTLAEVLKFGVDETDVASTQREARRLYQFACDEQSSVSQRNGSTSINASYSLFSAGAKNNSSSIDDYREKHCSLSEDDVASFATDSFRQRSVNPEAVDAWSACIGNQTGILLDPRLDPNQKVASFSITYDARRFAAVPTLRGISSKTFACQTAGTGDPIGVGGEPLAISPTEALVIRCDRDSDTSAIEGRPVTVYREDSMILDLSTGGHRIDFAERREGPVAEEFAQLQDRVRSLEAGPRVQSGIVGMTIYPDPDLVILPELTNRSGSNRGIMGERVEFDEPFSSAPEVIIALRYLDAGGGQQNTRISVVVTAVDREGFNYNFFTWSDTDIYMTVASWIAVARE